MRGDMGGTKSIIKSIIEQTFETSSDHGHNHVFTLGDKETSINDNHSHKITMTTTSFKLSVAGEGPHTHQVVGE